MSYNGVNEIIFLIIFGWLIFLSLITALSIIVMVTVSVIPPFRKKCAAYGLSQNAGKCVHKLLGLKSHGIGYFFNLMLIRQNENNLVIEEFLETAVKD